MYQQLAVEHEKAMRNLYIMQATQRNWCKPTQIHVERLHIFTNHPR